MPVPSATPATAPREGTDRVGGGRFELEDELGRGGMGTVYRVRERPGGACLALKRMVVREGEDRERITALFEREYLTLAQLSHPRIIQVYEYGIDEQGAFYTMELLDGADMRELSPMPYPRACRYLREVATSLSLLHARGLVHRDVTPRNVRLTSDDRCKLLDFGALAEAGEVGEVVGTPSAIPPEALDRMPADQRIDLYSLGCLAYYMLTGRHAYPATDTRQLPTYWARQPPPPSQCLADSEAGEDLPAIPGALDELVLSLIRPDAMARPSSISAVIDRLDLITGDGQRDETDLAESHLASAKLVGRDRPMQRGQRILQRLAKGRGGALGFSGEAGAGKTRLLKELALEAQLAGATVVRTDAKHNERPYSTVAAVVRSLLHAIQGGADAAAPSQGPVLAHFVPELRRLLDREPPELPTDPMRRRSLLLASLRGFVLDLSSTRPVVLLIDNIDHCDAASVVALSSLAYEANKAPLALLYTLRSVEEASAPVALAALTGTTRCKPLRGLSRISIRNWLTTLFGDARNIERLAIFLADRCAGNPEQCMTLLRFLLQNGDIRYRDGTWLLPAEPAACQLPPGTEAASRERLSRLSGGARELAQSLCMARGACSLTMCQTLSGASDANELQSQLDELIGQDVISLGAEGYSFVHESLREALVAEIETNRVPDLHRRIAQGILARDSLHVSERLEAAVHLLHAGDDAGVELAADAGAALLHNFDALGACVGNLETALQHLRARGSSPYQLAKLTAPLGMAAYMVDRRLAKHTRDLVALCEHVLGLSLARKLAPALGQRLGALVALGISVLRYRLRPKAERMSSFSELAQMLVGAVLALCGRAAICLDGAETGRLANLLKPLTALGNRHSATFCYDFGRGLQMITQDRCSATHAHFEDLQQRLQRKGSMQDVPEDSKRLWAGGIAYVLGVLEGFAGDARALERASELEQTGSDVHQLIAAQLRLQYHGFRGEVEDVRRAYDQLEAAAIQTGYGWQAETWSAAAINLFGSLWHDVVVAKRAMEESRAISEDVPAQARYATSSRAAYLFCRGAFEEAAQTFEELLSREVPREHIGWSTSMGLLADCYNHLGQHQRALELCQRALEKIDPADAKYYALHFPIDAALINAEAGLGNHGAVREHLNDLFARHERTQSPFALGATHELAARTALLRGDRKAFSEHLKQVEHYLCRLGNPSLIARFRNLAELGGSDGGIAAKIAHMRELSAFERAIAELDTMPLLARHILGWILEQYEGYSGFLFVDGPDGPELLASTERREPSVDVVKQVEQALRSLGSDTDTTAFGTEPVTRRDEVLGPTHVYLLSYLDAEDYRAEGAIVLTGKGETAPRIRYELLQIGAQRLNQLRNS